MLKGIVYKSYVRPAILCGCEVWCLDENEKENSAKNRDVLSAAHNGKGAKYLMLMFV